MNNLINQIRSISYTEANSIIRRISGIVDFFSTEDDKLEFVSVHEADSDAVCEDRVSYGDWQTPAHLSDKVCEKHIAKFGAPDIVVEPTCGLGAFLFSALKYFPDVYEIHALEINRQYTAELKYRLLLHRLHEPVGKHPDIYIYNADFFEFDFLPIVKKSEKNNWNLAIIGNPPWVTNSRQGKNNSRNLPSKKNIYGLKGIDAITGKSNFDISEYITLHLLNLSQTGKGGISFLLKNSVIRNIMEKQFASPVRIGNIEQSMIDSSSEFNVAVDASCFSAQIGCAPSLTCCLKDFYADTYIRKYGWVDGSFVSDIELYRDYAEYDSHSEYVWRSGIKHDCASVLELTLSDGVYVNGYGEAVRIEDDLIYPLLKSSDINGYQGDKVRKFLIVPQHRVGEDTSELKHTHPLAYSYLSGYEAVFSGRKSSIYKGKDRFSIFGVGDYSFKPYKVLISALYKTIKFILVSPYEGKPVMVDDTCYQLGFDNEEEARSLLNAVSSHPIQSLLKSLVFPDSKRVITKTILMRLNLSLLCKGKNPVESRQLSLFD